MIRTSKVLTYRLDTLENSLLRQYLNDMGYTDIRNYIQLTVINNYINDAVMKINKIKKNEG
jgi:hypothetical protein